MTIAFLIALEFFRPLMSTQTQRGLGLGCTGGCASADIRRYRSSAFTLCLRLNVTHLLLVLAPFALAGCSAAVQLATGKAAEIALNAMGIKASENPNGLPAAKLVPLRLEAAKDMNADENGQGLSAVLRLYKLRNQTNFLSTPYSAFGNPDKEKQAMGPDLVEVREMILSPGQAIDLKEKMSNEAPYLGVVTLFRSPFPKRWRFAFATSDAEGSGVTIGIHACAMTSTNAAPVGMTVAETTLLSTVKCK